MAKGIQVIWRDDANTVFEIEYFDGIDVDDLDNIPAVSSVSADWPSYNGGTGVRYKVRAQHEPGPDDELHLVVEYHAAENPELAGSYNHGWGTNRIVLVPGSQNGRCRWLASDGTERNDVPWRAFDVTAANQRPLAKYIRSQRYSQFRSIVLSHDGHRCALTGDPTVQALEVAHLIPARYGENDVPSNGIALRADLHRLFDAGLFTFAPDGRVVLADHDPRVSDVYDRLLRNAELRSETFERVRGTLAERQFRNRKCARA